MSSLIATDAQRLSQNAIVELYELDASSFGEGVLRFTPTSDGGKSLFLSGDEFFPVPIEVEGFEWSGTGTLPRPTMTLAVQDISFLSMVISSKDLHGCPVRRIRTYRKYLDDGSNPNPTATYPIDHFEIDRKKSETRGRLSFELSPKSDREGKQVPALQILRDTCLHRFRYWNGANFVYDGVTCPYTGDTMYDANDEITADPAKAACGHRVSSCTRHFGQDAVLPIRCFPGVGRV